MVTAETVEMRMRMVVMVMAFSPVPATVYSELKLSRKSKKYQFQ